MLEEDAPQTSLFSRDRFPFDGWWLSAPTRIPRSATEYPNRPNAERPRTAETGDPRPGDPDRAPELRGRTVGVDAGGAELNEYERRWSGARARARRWLKRMSGPTASRAHNGRPSLRETSSWPRSRRARIDRQTEGGCERRKSRLVAGNRDPLRGRRRAVAVGTRAGHHRVLVSMCASRRSGAAARMGPEGETEATALQ